MASPKRGLVTLLLLVAGMFAFAYAAFPLYNLFCKVTGYGGTTQRAEVLPEGLGTRNYTIRFNADISPKLPWDFEPNIASVQTVPGKPSLISYRAKNTSDQLTSGVATFNVAPAKVGKYFVKVQCFCFEDQPLHPGEEVMMPVSFTIDPAIEEDASVADVDTITLSYTFFEKKD